ncbi:MAG: hypothetical protein IH991_22700 [Planctomycetes bacterium]|nr:hypothetical protein [Planctomycetota bacterium]
MLTRVIDRFKTLLLPMAIWIVCSVVVTSALLNETARAQSAKRLFHPQYHIADPSFCNVGACLDMDGDGKRKLFFASRKTRQLKMLNAATGDVVWSKKFDGQQQSLSAFDLNADGEFEVLYSVSGPGRLYILDKSGTILKSWDSGDWKLGNSPVLLDADRDGILDGYLGTRGKQLVRLNMNRLLPVQVRGGWSQCGCHTSAMDVDRDGKWDLFAGSGDDGGGGKGVIHRFDPISLKTLWSFKTNDNASSADLVLADIDGDGQVEIIKSVDNYGKDDPHDALYAFETDGTLIWKVAGLSGEDSPNVADLDGDGSVEIVGMTFGGEVYCLDGRGRFLWRKDLRPEIDNDAHTYMTPIICDLNGDRKLEILALTSGGYFADSVKKSKNTANGILFALSADGTILDRYDIGEPRFFGEAFVTNVDDDPFLELVVAGSGGLDVIETRGFGANVEYFQRRRTYQRLNVFPWAYEDTFFIHRGTKDGVANLTDNIVLKKTDRGYKSSGRYVTQLLTLPPGCFFDRLEFTARTPASTSVSAKLIDKAGKTVQADIRTGTKLHVDHAVRIEFVLSTSDRKVTPILDDYRLSFDREAR